MGGQRLYKGSCRSPDVGAPIWRLIISLLPSERAPSIRDLDLEDLPMDCALGTQWDVERDTLSFKVAKREVPNTRSGMLSLISGLYDPLGFVAPFILPAKML